MIASKKSQIIIDFSEIYGNTVYNLVLSVLEHYVARSAEAYVDFRNNMAYWLIDSIDNKITNHSVLAPNDVLQCCPIFKDLPISDRYTTANFAKYDEYEYDIVKQVHIDLGNFIIDFATHRDDMFNEKQKAAIIDAMNKDDKRVEEWIEAKRKAGKSVYY